MINYNELNEESKKAVQFVKYVLTTCEDIQFEDFIKVAQEWVKENNIDMSKVEPMACPVVLFLSSNKSKSCYRTVQGIAYCPVCNKPCCPECHMHKVGQLSRVTGYIQEVSGWNIAKQQELKDRKRYEINK